MLCVEYYGILFDIKILKESEFTNYHINIVI